MIDARVKEAVRVIASSVQEVTAGVDRMIDRIETMAPCDECLPERAELLLELHRMRKLLGAE